MSDEQPHILVVDDDRRLRALLGRYLGENGFRVTVAENADAAEDKLRGIAFDLMILDVMMPGRDGISFARDLRRVNPMPILMLTAMGEATDRIAGLEAGVDDYLTKPFEPRELLLRLRSILRRLPVSPPPPHEPIALGEVVFDPDSEELRRGDAAIALTATEANLLKVFATRPGEALDREELLRLSGTEGGGRTVDVQVTRLRKKIEPDPAHPRYLQTVRGKGYRLRPS